MFYIKAQHTTEFNVISKEPISKGKDLHFKIPGLITSDEFPFHKLPGRGKQVFWDIEDGGLSEAGAWRLVGEREHTNEPGMVDLE